MLLLAPFGRSAANIYKVKIKVKRFNQPVKMEVVSAKPKVGTCL